MLSGIALFLLFVFALLAIPVTMMFEVTRRQALQGQVTLLWAFGLVRVHIPLPVKRAASPGAKRATQKRRQRGRSGSKSKPLALIRYRPFRRRVFRFVADLWRAIRKQDVNLRIRLGLGDPADTGRLWAVVGPVAGLLANVEEASVEIEPDFMDAVFELESSGEIRLIPLQILYLVVALLLSPPVWLGVKRMRRAGEA